MSAEIPQRRTMTARQAAEKIGVSERMIRRVVAEPRDDYDRRAKERGEQILAWREEGILWREIADRLNVSTGAAQMAGNRALKRQLKPGNI